MALNPSLWARTLNPNPTLRPSSAAVDRSRPSVPTQASPTGASHNPEGKAHTRKAQLPTLPDFAPLEKRRTPLGAGLGLLDLPPLRLAGGWWTSIPLGRLPDLLAQAANSLSRLPTNGFICPILALIHSFRISNPVRLDSTVCSAFLRSVTGTTYSMT